MSQSKKQSELTLNVQAIKNKLDDLKIKDKDDFHNKLVNDVLNKGVDEGLAGHSKDIAPVKLRALTEALKELEQNTQVKKVTQKLAKEQLNQLIKTKLIELNIKDEGALHSRIIESVWSKGELSAALNQHKQDIAPIKFKNFIDALLPLRWQIDANLILQVLERLHIDNEDETSHDKIVDVVLKNGADAVKQFAEFIASNVIDQLVIELYELFGERRPYNEGQVMNNSEKSKPNDNQSEHTEKEKKDSDVYTLAFEVDFNYFNALDSSDSTHVDFADAVEKSFGQYNFAEVIARRMIYLIKRQQDLRGFIDDLQKRVTACKMTSLRQLLCAFLLNCSDDVRVKCYQLLSANNPVPAIIGRGREHFALESYWIATAYDEGSSTTTRILSCGLDASCTGKSKLLNELFRTSFEENVYGRNQPLFNGTVDMQLVRNFGEPGNHLCIADAHGVVGDVLLLKIAGAFDAILVQLDEASVGNVKYVDLIGKLASRVRKRLFIIVRDSKNANRNDCCNQEKIKSSLAQMPALLNVHGARIKLCRVPTLVKDNQLRFYGDNIRCFLFDQGLNSVATKNQYDINAKMSALMELYSEPARGKIDTVNNGVRPLVKRLVEAISDKGIKQTELLAIYPLYFEFNRIKNELDRMVFYAQNSERIHELQVKLSLVLDELQLREKHAKCDLYTLFRPLLASSDYVLMASLVVKSLSAAFQKERDALIQKSRMQPNNSTEKNTDNNQNEVALAKLNETIDMKRISLDVIWRELMLLFNQRPDEHKHVGDKFAELLFKGQPFEILDGDNFRFNEKFLKTIFEAHKQHQRIRVITILGPQNSGKSTLLNFMFGCDFSVSDGRCTRGIYGSFIKATGESANKFDYLLVLDTEGLQSIEKGDPEYDRKLILFAFAVSNIVILNAKDQITEDFKATLEICVDSLSKIEMARVHRPSVYFVMNQKADPNKHNDQEAINKIIDRFTSNGLIEQLHLDDKNFETLPSAFNSNIVRIKPPNHELRFNTTSADFTKRVAAFSKNIIDQVTKKEDDDTFSNIVKWIEFSYLVFDLITTFPDLTFFRTVAARTQQKQLQQFINQKILAKLSNVEKEALFDEISKNIEADDDHDKKAIADIHTFFVIVKKHMTKDLDEYLQSYSVAAEIKQHQEQFLVSQINQIKELWEHEVRIRISESRLRREIHTGEGIITAKINSLLLSGNTFTKEEASSQFDIIFDDRLTSLQSKINDSIKTNTIFDLMFSSYNSFSNAILPTKSTVMEFNTNKKTHVWQSCGFYKSIELIHLNLDLPSAWLKFKTIDGSEFALFYYQCCLNLKDALKHIAKLKGKMVHQFTNELGHNFKVGPRSGQSFQSTNVNLKDLMMIELPPLFQCYQEKDKADRLQALMNDFQSKDNQLLRIYKQEEYASIIVQFVQLCSTIKSDWDLIFNKTKYISRVTALVDDFLKNKNNFDHELIQTFIPKLQNVFDDYNNDLRVIGLSLSQETTSLAHKIAFCKMFELFSAKIKKEAYSVQELWMDKRPELLQFFVSQLAPDKAKDEKNAKEFMRKLLESIYQTLSKRLQTLITTRLNEKEDYFSRLHLQANRDATLTSLSAEDLLKFVIHPTEFMLNDFTVIWNDFKNSLILEFDNIKFEYSKMLDELKNSFKKLNTIMAPLKTKPETFNAQALFKTTQLLPESQNDINKNVHLKSSNYIDRLPCSTKKDEQIIKSIMTIISLKS